MCITNMEGLIAKYLDSTERCFERMFRERDTSFISYPQIEERKNFANEEEERRYYVARFSENYNILSKGPKDEKFYFCTVDILREVMAVEDQNKLTQAFADELENQLPFVRMVRELHRIIMDDYAWPAWKSDGRHNSYPADVYGRILVQLNESYVISVLQEAKPNGFQEFYQEVLYKSGTGSEYNQTWIDVAKCMAEHIWIPVHREEENSIGGFSRTLATHFKFDISGRPRTPRQAKNG